MKFSGLEFVFAQSSQKKQSQHPQRLLSKWGLEASQFKFFEEISSWKDISNCLVRGADHLHSKEVISTIEEILNLLTPTKWEKSENIFKNLQRDPCNNIQYIQYRTLTLVSYVNRTSWFGCKIQWPPRHPGHGVLHVNDGDRSHPGSGPSAGHPSREPQAEG